MPDSIHADEEPDALPFARQLEAGRRPRRWVLRLDDGYETSVYVHPARAATRLPVVYLHGIQSHPGWFAGSAAHLADCGYPVFQVTRRGSGDNRRHRGHARSAGQILRDVNTACRWAMEQTNTTAVHMVGVSWGGKLACAWAVWPGRCVEPASVTLIAPGIASQVHVRFGVKVGVGAVLFAAPRKRFDIPLNEVELFTDREAMREFLRRDSFRLHRATARLLYASARLDEMLKRAPQGALRVPVTLLLARRDRIIDNAATAQQIERLSAGRAQVKYFESAHVLEFQEDPSPFYAALVEAVSRGPEGSP